MVVLGLCTIFGKIVMYDKRVLRNEGYDFDGLIPFASTLWPAFTKYKIDTQGIHGGCGDVACFFFLTNR